MVFVIAEVGVNHGGSSRTAHYLVEAAAKAGADACKFQTFDCEKLDPPGERREMLRKLQLTQSNHIALKYTAGDLGIEFMSTPFDVESLRFLVDDLGVKTLKIASGNLDNEPLLRAANMSGLRVIVSTGMATLDEVRDADLRLAGVSHCMLHCTSAYPTPIEDVNLRAMVTMRDNIGCEVGLSDHTEDIVVPIAAVALGATVIEKHLTLDRRMDGPDHLCSLEPDDFAEMVRGIRTVEKALGDGVKAPRDSEDPVMQIAMERKTWREKQCAA